MILYINGDSHTAAAEAVNPHAFAEDDGRYFYLRRAPHPDNLAVSWGRLLSDRLKTTFKCDAESASSNDRIIRTTQSWLQQHQDEWYRTLVIIQWSTWEREEWPHAGQYFQVNASGIDDVPDELKQRYKEFVAGIDWQIKTQQAHEKIWQFHGYLESIQVPHVFFNGDTDFSSIKEKKDWGRSYIGPYDPKSTFSAILKSQGHETVAPNSYHFGRLAHSSFSRFMLQYCIDNKFI